ncbi:MAG TPA: tetratricopeptide repeat-containing sensor histidine kinase, partial [Cyclobacteriaceae bacterium]|nr:tetratricopeptide repeat-containing sensor histidine kinase [Cyclobacteriaceae bacterium]
LLDCLFIYRQLQDHYNEARVLKSMGTIYEYFGDQHSAIESYLRSVHLSKLINDSNLESNAYNPLSGIYLKRGEPGLAMETIEKSVSIKEQTKDTRGLAFALYGRGKVYLHLKQFEKAQADLNNALQLQIKMGDKLGVSMAYNKIGLLFYELKDYSEAKKYLGMALEFAVQYDIQVIQSKAYYHLHLVAKAEGNAVEALRYLECYNKIKEGVINTQTFNVIKSYEAKSKIEALEREAQSQRDKTDIIEKKNAELDSFFYRVSHDLKGPISSLIGLHNLIKMEVKDEHAQRYFDMYQSQIMRINNIVMDLIELTRMNHTQDSRVKINFRASLDDCINAYHYLENFKYITFIKEIDESIEFYSEWAIVNTILQNLIENAIKYARIDREPFIRVAISRENDDFLKIIVEDNGMGIRDDFKAKVFNMFFRANDRVQGTGLGLYILKRAVERLNGDVTFESDVKTGSVFRILLPLNQT